MQVRGYPGVDQQRIGLSGGEKLHSDGCGDEADIQPGFGGALPVTNGDRGDYLEKVEISLNFRSKITAYLN